MPYLETIPELLEAKEGEHVQFKEAKNRFDFGEAARCCCALANNGGGKLVFGITDKRPRQVVGSRAFEQPERTRMGLIDKLKINVDFQLYDYEGKRVLVFDDILTKGHSYAQFACALEQLGAEVLGGYFLGRTILSYN